MKYLVLFLLLVTPSIILFSSVSNEKADPKIIPVTTPPPEENKIYPIAVIGSGAAGTMAVKRIVLNNDEVLLFTGAKSERRRSRGNWVRKVDNIPGFEKYSRTVLELRNESLKELLKSDLSHNLFVIEDSITEITKENEIFKLKDQTGRTFFVKYVILATGIMDEQPHIQESIRPILDFANGQTVAYCLICDGHRSFRKKTVIIGHSEETADAAILLSDKYSLTDVTILTNGKPPEFNRQEMLNRKIQINENPIIEILGDRSDQQLTGFKLQNGEIVEAEMGFVSLGIRPNNQLALQLGAQVDARGLVITDKDGETSIPNLFVAGDLRAQSMKQIYTAWQHAVECAQIINWRLRSAVE